MTLKAAVTSEEKSTCPGESIKLIRNLSNLIDKIDNNNYFDYSDENEYDAMAMFNDSVRNYARNNKEELVMSLFKQTTKTLKTILLNTYGINTLVINHEDYYNEVLKNYDPNYYVGSAKMKRPFIEYTYKRKK